MIMSVEKLMARIGELGVTAIIKVEGGRGPGDDRWTFIVSGGPLSAPVRVDSSSLSESLSRGISLLKSRGEEWQWLDKVIVGDSAR